MSSQTPMSPFVRSFQKPQAKSLSPVSRNLFGASDATVVAQMLKEVLVSERRRGVSDLNFDIHIQKPIKQEQQENVSDVDKTPEPRKRFYWKTMKTGDVPEFYSRRYKGKKCLMPVDLLNCSPESANASGRSRSVRRSLNGYLRSPSKELKTPSAVRPSSASRFQQSPLRTSSPQKITESPVSFDAACEGRIPVPVVRPLPLHASTENTVISKMFSPIKSSVSSRLSERSPLSQRENQTTRGVRALDFSIPKRLPSVFSSRAFNFTNNANVSSSTPGCQTTSSDSQTTPISMTPTTRLSVVPRPMKQLKITDVATMKKSRSPALKARKRLNLSEDDSSNVPSTKTPRLTHGTN